MNTYKNIQNYKWDQKTNKETNKENLKTNKETNKENPELTKKFTECLLRYEKNIAR